MPGYMDSFMKSKQPPMPGAKPGLAVTVGVGKPAAEPGDGSDDGAAADMMAGQAALHAFKMGDAAGLARAIKVICGYDDKDSDADDAESDRPDVGNDADQK